MKTLKPFCQNFLVKIFAGFILLNITGREHSDIIVYPDPAYSAEAVQWKDLLQQLDFESNIIIVRKDACIKDAIDAAASSHESGWHFFGGNENEFYYTDPLRFFRMAVILPPYIPLRIYDDLDVCGFDEEDVSFDDHLAEISAPILNLGAGGCSGTTGNYTSSQTAGSDLTHNLVSIPGTDPASDNGHADLWFGLVLTS
jgi:hypothetical protein